MAFTEKDKVAMDHAAVDAQNELIDMPDEALVPVANWFARWYMKAGYKRLGRVLLEYAEKKEPAVVIGLEEALGVKKVQEAGNKGKEETGSG